jgi:hypothetical protein
MGMVFNYYRLSQNELDTYLKESSLLEDKLSNDNDYNYDNPDYLYIDKSWDGILYLLTGNGFENNTHPLSRVFFTDQIIDENQDLGYGPGMYLNPEQVYDLSRQLSLLTDSEVACKFDAKDMLLKNVYPDIWEDETTLEYLMEYFSQVRTFFKVASENSQAMIMFMN